LALGDAELYRRDPERAQRLARGRGKLIEARARAEGAWLAASEAYEAAAAEVKDGVA
jgi:ATP-binding cassette subfamily F protein 3